MIKGEMFLGKGQEIAALVVQEVEVGLQDMLPGLMHVCNKCKSLP
jgi:hypothetical protein